MVQAIVLAVSVLASPRAQGAPDLPPGDVVRQENPAEPRDGNIVVHPRELWRRGGDGDDFLFGFIITAAVDAEGCVYLLDRWLATVHVIGPDGRFLRQLSRPGDGPGETNQPTDLTWLPHGGLGIVQPAPGRLVRIDRAGNPLGDLVPEGVSARAAEFGFLIEAGWRGGALTCAGTRTNFRDGALETSNFLAVCDLDTGKELARVLAGDRSDDGRTELREADLYWINEGRWCLGPAGEIYVAARRDRYEVDVHAADGRLERVVGRDYEPWRRTEDEKERLRTRLARPVGEWGGGRGVRVADDEPCIAELHVTDGGELWVRHSRSTRDQAPGVFATWDVFAADGAYAHTLSIAVPGDPRRDRLLILDDRRLLLVRGYTEASDAMWGDGAATDREEVGEIICFELPR